MRREGNHISPKNFGVLLGTSASFYIIKISEHILFTLWWCGKDTFVEARGT
jgi:hypothetical protein